MSENQSKISRAFGMVAPLSLAIGLALSTQIGLAADPAHLTAMDGAKSQPVVTGFGECWQSVGGSTEPMAKCGGVDECADDTDKDGVPDCRDKCPDTPAGCPVDADGCPVDADGDGVIDCYDKCPGTPAGAKVDANGCDIIADLVVEVTADHFDFDSAKLKPKMKAILDDVADRVKASPGDEQLEIVGHTDSTGPDAYNQKLSERRARSAADYLVARGVSSSKISTRGMGESQPVTDNSTDANRAKNRRVEIFSK